MQDGPSASDRVKGLTIVKPIVFGNVSTYFGKLREDGHTHRWTIYVKPYHNEDMSSYVKKIHFKLHESYSNPNRILTEPPYEVTETGWGEFDVAIKIFFNDANVRPVSFTHFLKLFQLGGGNDGAASNSVVSERYDEIVFVEPTHKMHQLLVNTKPVTPGPWKHNTDFEEKKKKTIESLTTARTKVRNEISELKDRLQLARDTIAMMKEQIAMSKNK